MSKDRHIYSRRFEVYVDDKLVEEIELEKGIKDIFTFEIKKIKNYLKSKYRFSSGHYEIYEIFYSKANIQCAKNPRKLNSKQIEEIFFQRERGYTASQLASKYKVSDQTIYRILKNNNENGK